MKPERKIEAGRPLARHCPELLSRKPGIERLLPDLQAFATRFAERLPGALSVMCGGRVPEVSVEAIRDCIARDWLHDIRPPSANSLLENSEHRIKCLISTEGRGLFSLLDLAFGGRGAVPDSLPEALPDSIGLLIPELARIYGETLSQSTGEGDAPSFACTASDANIFKLAAFEPRAPLVSLAFNVRLPGCDSWSIRLAVEPAAATGLHGASPASAAQGRRIAVDSIELPLAATLGHIRLPVATAARLQPGQVLPLTMNRPVPLFAGDKAIAFGSVGAVENRVALQIIQSRLQSQGGYHG